MFAYMAAMRRHAKDEGASAVEYGLLVAAIAAVIVVIVFALGGLVRNKFTSTCNAIDTNGTNTATAAAGNCTNP
jgi:pilus assembly protein Flp/PilA